ncbi:MAG TPA: type II toxin-antitoxin system HipA family toxin [Solirubrobacterales bacterium]|nr:type II toxin-antitoxin system HipA family toxin [Solirubrobacterales bacterium]
MANPALDVRLNGRHAGILLRKDNGNLQFRYAEAYVEDAGPPLSVNLPVRTEAFSHRDCLAFFGNLLPEEDVRAQVALTTGISAANDYKLLERFGGDVAGAVTLFPSGQEEEGDGPDDIEVLPPERLDEVLVQLPQRPLGLDSKGEVRMSLAGAQSKLPVVQTSGAFALPHSSQRPTTHILKPEPERFPGLVANEFFCMRLGAEVGLNVAQVERAQTTSGLPYLIVTRYDRDLTREPIRRLHQEDFCQALGKLYVEKYQHEGGPGVREVMDLIDEQSTAPARDRQQLWLALVFNVLIGNCDAHGKNYSLLYDSLAPSLAPFYDLLSTAAYDELTTRLAMSIDGATHLDEVDDRAWERLAGQVGFAPRFLQERMAPFVREVSAAAERLSKQDGFASAPIGGIVSSIRDRAARFSA